MKDDMAKLTNVQHIEALREEERALKNQIEELNEKLAADYLENCHRVLGYRPDDDSIELVVKESQLSRRLRWVIDQIDRLEVEEEIKRQEAAGEPA